MYFELLIGPIKLGYVSRSNQNWVFQSLVESSDEKIDQLEDCKYAEYTECIRDVKKLFPKANDIISIIHYQDGKNIGFFNHEGI